MNFSKHKPQLNFYGLFVNTIRIIIESKEKIKNSAKYLKKVLGGVYFLPLF